MGNLSAAAQCLAADKIPAELGPLRPIPRSSSSGVKRQPEISDST